MNGILKSGQFIDFSYQGEKEIVQDKKILRNVFLNLFSNATKYSEGNKTTHFTIGSKHCLVSISVRDKRIGIPEEEQRNLFGKFYRAKNATNTGDCNAISPGGE